MCKQCIMASALPNGNALVLVSITTPPCYNILVANPTSHMAFGLATMTVAEEMLHCCLSHSMFAMFAIEMVLCGRRKLQCVCHVCH